MQAREAASQQRVTEAEKEGQLSAGYQQIKEIATDPAQLPTFLIKQSVQALPSILVSLIPFVGPAAAAELRVLQLAAKTATTTAAREAAEAGIGKIAANAAAKQALGVASVQQGSDIGTGTYEDAYKQLIKNGVAEPEAADQALSLARKAGASAAVISALTQSLPGAQAMERAIAGERVGASGRLLRGLGIGAKEAITEIPEEVGGRAARNVALMQVNPEQTLTEGLGATAGQAAIGGFGMGAVTGLATGNKGAPVETPTEAANAKAVTDFEEKKNKRLAELAKELPETEAPAPTTEATPAESPMLALPAPPTKIEEPAPKVSAKAEAQYRDTLEQLKTEATGIQDFTPEEVTSRLATILQQRYEPVTPLAGVAPVEIPPSPKMVEVAKALYANAVKQGDLEVTPVENAPSRVTVPAYDTKIPGNVSIRQEAFKAGEEPSSYDIRAGNTVLSTANTAEEAQAKADRASGFRATEAARIQKEIAAVNSDAQKNRDIIERMEALGESNTPAYAESVANNKEFQAEVATLLPQLEARLNALQAESVRVKPVGMRPITRDGHTVYINGKPSVTLPTRQAAEEHVLTNLPEKTLKQLATAKRLHKLTERAQAELQTRLNTQAEIKAPRTAVSQPTREAITGVKETRPVTEEVPLEDQARKEQLNKLLMPLMKQMGLGNVGLEAVRAITNNADGSYAAKLIRIAFDAKNPVRVLKHEGIHALKALGFFTPQQWTALENQAIKTWIDKYLVNVKQTREDGTVTSRLQAYKDMGLSNEDLMEEAIADAFADFDATQAPSGMIAALLKRMRLFFNALRSAVTGAGYDNADDIFGKVTRGELKEAVTPAEPTAEEKLSLARDRDDRNLGPRTANDNTISTRVPRAVSSTEDLMADKLNVGIGAVLNDPALLKKHADLVRNDPLMGSFKSDSDVATINHFVDALKDNLVYLWKATPKNIRERSRNWYIGANQIANNLAEQAGISKNAASGVLAALSPQTPWDVNVSQAGRVITIWKDQQNTVTDQRMLDWFDSKIALLAKKEDPAFMVALKEAVEGKTFKDLNGQKAQAWWLRAYDESHHSREYHLVAPEGKPAGLMLKKSGEPANMPWGNTGNIDKAISILNDGSLSNISKSLGVEHKVRSFYNNISEPNSLEGHVTIDTHAVAAARFEPLSGNTPEVAQAWGGQGSSSVAGQGGLYGEYAEAYRQAADEVNALPRELQSVTWEKVRGLFPDTFKTTKAVNDVKSIWSKFQRGEITTEQVRADITAISPNQNPNWHGVRTEPVKGTEPTEYAAEPATGAVRDRQAATGRQPTGVKLSLRAPETEAFKRWFGDSKVVDEDGKPLIVYHGTANNITAFDKSKQDIKDAGFWFGSKQDASGYGYRNNGNVMPVYLSMKNPKVYYNRDVKITPELITKLQAQGFDGVKRDFAKGKDAWRYGADAAPEWAVFEPTQVKSATGNIGTYDATNPNIRYSLRDQLAQLPSAAAIQTQVDDTTTARVEVGHAARMIDALSSKHASKYRQAYLNRYNQIGVYGKAASKALNDDSLLLADASAEAAALMSDNAASVAAEALGVGNRKGGIPVYKNGYFTVDGSEKGAVEIFAPLAKKGDPLIYQYYQYWSGVKRGSRFISEGREQLFTDPASIAYAKEIEAMFPEFVTVQKEWITYNDGLVKMMVDAGVLTPEAGVEFTKHGDYLPFYRQLDGEQTVGPNIFQSIAGVKPPKKLKGGEAPLGDFLENVVRNTQASIEASMKNVAAQRAIRDAVTLGTATKLNHVAAGLDVVPVFEKGLKTFYRVSDPLWVEAIQGLNLPAIPLLGIVAAPANLLRTMVTKDPAFMLANMLRDSLSTWVTSGAKMTPVVDTIANFGKALAGLDPVVGILHRAGLGGGFDFSGNVESSAREFSKTLRKATQTRTSMEKLASPVTGLWQLLEKGSEASELATRVAVYKSTLEKTGNEAEAIFQAMEVLNFNRKGNSPLVRILTAAVPFLNARMQGLDVLYRAGFGKNATKDVKERQRAFFVRGTTIMALSILYAMAMQDDEDYNKQEQEVRDNYWLFPSLGIKIPIPFELGIIFKVIPERIYAYSFGTDTGKDFRQSMARQIMTTLSVNPIPQALMPYVEAKTNYSFFTQRPVVPRELADVDAKFQVAPSTSGLAKRVGEKLNMSPIQIDHIIGGYTGTMGMYMVQAMNSIFEGENDPTRASLRVEQLPVWKRFAVDKDARGQVSAYYELKHETDAMVRTVNILEASHQYSELAEYQQDNLHLLATKEYVKTLNSRMTELQGYKKQIQNSQIEPDDKRDALLALTQAQNAIASNTKTLRKMMSEAF